jgi:hypothetical protein
MATAHFYFGLPTVLAHLMHFAIRSILLPTSHHTTLLVPEIVKRPYWMKGSSDSAVYYQSLIGAAYAISSVDSIVPLGRLEKA